MLQNKNCNTYVVTYLHQDIILLRMIYSVEYHPFPAKLLIFIPAFFTKSFTFIVSMIFRFAPLTIARVLVCPSDTTH